MRFIRRCMLLYMMTMMTLLVMGDIFPMCLATIVVMMVMVMVMPSNSFCYLVSRFFKLFPYMFQGIECTLLMAQKAPFGQMLPPRQPTSMPLQIFFCRNKFRRGQRRQKWPIYRSSYIIIYVDSFDYKKKLCNPSLTTSQA